MHIETLKVFCDLVDTGSFSVAAAQNFVTQSAVSQQIRTLETRYGRKLVERTKRRVRPTPAGEIFYEVSKEIVTRYNDLEARLQAFSNIVAGTVRVATVHSVGLYEFADELKRFVKAYPNVNVRLEYKKSNQIYEDVLAGTLDVGVIAYPSKRPQIRLIPFREDRLVLICAPGCSLGRWSPVAPTTPATSRAPLPGVGRRLTSAEQGRSYRCGTIHSSTTFRECGDCHNRPPWGLTGG